MKIVVLSEDWADEFNADGFEIMTDEQYKEFDKAIEALPDDLEGQEFFFGTNEALQWHTKQQLRDSLKIRDITEEECDTITQALGMNGKSYGLFPISTDALQDIVEDLKEEATPF